MPLSVLIVDDEKLSRAYIHDLVLEIDPVITVFEASSVEKAIPILEHEKIDILFTDIKMPESDGFRLLRSVTHRNFDLIFVTAYAEYAIQAIKEGAADYILKPIKKTEFRETFRKILQRREEDTLQRSTHSQNENYLTHRLTLSHQQGVKFITLKDIVYLEANNTYTTIVLISGERIIASKPISRFEDKLDTNWFYRIHKSHIINLYYFKEYLSKDGDIAVMTNGDKLPISKYRLSDFLRIVEDVSGRLKI